MLKQSPSKNLRNRNKVRWLKKLFRISKKNLKTYRFKKKMRSLDIPKRKNNYPKKLKINPKKIRPNI
jgi:hypothetical protein